MRRHPLPRIAALLGLLAALLATAACEEIQKTVETAADVIEEPSQ
jgi:hypothetical protein